MLWTQESRRHTHGGRGRGGHKGRVGLYGRLHEAAQASREPESGPSRRPRPSRWVTRAVRREDKTVAGKAPGGSSRQGQAGQAVLSSQSKQTEDDWIGIFEHTVCVSLSFFASSKTTTWVLHAASPRGAPLAAGDSHSWPTVG